MKQSTLLCLSVSLVVAGLIAVAAPGRAQAQAAAEGTVSRAGGTGSGAGIGVGAVQFLSGLTGAQVVFDQARFHIEGMLGFDSRTGGGNNPPRTTTFDIGAAGWYHFYVGPNSDFSLGGGIGIATASTSNNGGSLTATVFEPGVQARVFVTPNVAVHGRVGLTLSFGDNVGGATQHVGLGGQILTGFGFTYFFR